MFASTGLSIGCGRSVHPGIGMGLAVHVRKGQCLYVDVVLRSRAGLVEEYCLLPLVNVLIGMQYLLPGGYQVGIDRKIFVNPRTPAGLRVLFR